MTRLVERLGQVLCALLVCDILVGWVGSKKFSLTVQRCGHGLLRIDILLTPIHHTNEAESKRVCPPGQDIIGIGSGIHKIELG